MDLADELLFFAVGVLRPADARFEERVNEEGMSQLHSCSSSTLTTLTTSVSTGDTGEGEENIEASEWERDGVGEGAVAT